MARPIEKRYRVSGCLVAESPLHVGGSASNVATDLPLALDGAGRWYIPGTGLAGALRAWQRWACEGDGWSQVNSGLVTGAAKSVADTFVDWLWGYTPSSGDDTLRGTASHVIVEDAPVAVRGRVETRDGVGIDRVDGRAADGIKYDLQTLPRGSKIPLEMTVEVPSEGTAAHGDQRGLGDRGVRAALGHLLRALERGEVRLGAAKTRGLGRVRLREGCRVTEQPLLNRNGILAALAGDTGTELRTKDLLVGAGTLAAKPRPRLEITIDWEAAGPVMVKADAEGISVDMVPLVGSRGGALAPLIPGSSLKGALRSQAERITATVLGAIADEDLSERSRFQEHLARCKQTARVDYDLVQALFGAPGEPTMASARGQKKKMGTGPLPGLGAVAVDDCLARQEIGAAQWRAILDADAGSDTKSQARLMGTLVGAGLDGFYPATHVAIDRWTGGAAEGFLYSVLEPHGLNWDDIVISVDLTRLADPANAAAPPGDKAADDGGEAQRRMHRGAAIALLLLALRDLALQRIPIGFGGNRGLAAVKVNTIHIRAVDPPQDGEDPLGAKVIRELDGLALRADDFGEAATLERLKPLEAVWRRFLTPSGEEP